MVGGILFMLMFAVMGRERGRLLRLLLLPLLLSFAVIHSNAASAASLSVKIRQVNPDSAPQQVTCTRDTKCVLPLKIKTNQSQTVDVNVRIEFVPGNALLEFQTGKGFLYAGDKNPPNKQHGTYEVIWHSAVAKDKASVSGVTLFLPAVPHAEVAPILQVPQQAVADLEITLEAAP